MELLGEIFIWIAGSAAELIGVTVAENGGVGLNATNVYVNEEIKDEKGETLITSDETLSRSYIYENGAYIRYNDPEALQ